MRFCVVKVNNIFRFIKLNDFKPLFQIIELQRNNKTPIAECTRHFLNAYRQIKRSIEKFVSSLWITKQYNQTVRSFTLKKKSLKKTFIDVKITI